MRLINVMVEETGQIPFFRHFFMGKGPAFHGKVCDNESNYYLWKEGLIKSDETTYRDPF